MEKDNKNSEKYVLITGASTGIGYELSKLFAKDGYSLILVARNLEKLGEVKKELQEEYGIKILITKKDLSKEDAIKELYDKIKKQNIEISILVNNAGFGEYGSFKEQDINNLQNMIDLNIKSLTTLTHYYLSDIIKNQGKIMNVASIASFLPIPKMAVYAATKAYVLSFSEAIKAEVKKKGVTVTALCPGATSTGFQKRANIEESDLMKDPNLMTAEQVAKIGYKDLMKGKSISITGFKNKLLVFAIKVSPRKLISKILQKKF